MKSRIIEMETEVQQAKTSYNEALQSLEKISDEIHKLREDQKLNEYHEEVSSGVNELSIGYAIEMGSQRPVPSLNPSFDNRLTNCFRFDRFQPPRKRLPAVRHISVIKTAYRMTTSSSTTKTSPPQTRSSPRSRANGRTYRSTQ